MEMEDRWETLAYLARGTPRQRAAYEALAGAAVMEALAPWHPVLAGTIPLGIDIEGSDLDILCEVWEPGPFLARLRAAFGSLPGFAVREKAVGGLPSIIARFAAGGFPVEVFAQPRPVRQQNGYRHLLVEARLLELAGPGAAEAIRRVAGAATGGGNPPPISPLP